MKVVSNIFAIIISIIIICLPLVIFIFHYKYACEYLLFVSKKNNEEVNNILKNEKYYNVEPTEHIKRIELYSKRLTRYYILRVYYKNNKIDETVINRENNEYEIVDYLENNAINVDKLMTYLNIIALFLIAVIIPDNRKNN